jgi:hypothetical protein
VPDSKVDKATYTFTEDTDTAAVGPAVKTSDETVIRATSAIIHEDSSAERLLIRETILCMAGQELELEDGSLTLFGSPILRLRVYLSNVIRVKKINRTSLSTRSGPMVK